jgi:hypothetical protein
MCRGPARWRDPRPQCAADCSPSTASSGCPCTAVQPSSGCDARRRRLEKWYYIITILIVELLERNVSIYSDYWAVK